jgi:hypothetical protein
MEKKMLRKISYGLTFILLIGLTHFAFASVMINEILYDTIGRDDSTQMYTELWGEPGTDVSGYTLVGINGNGGTEYRTITIPQGTSIPTDGYLVIGNRAQVPNVDVNLNVNSDDGVDWQNAGTSSSADCDGLDLRDSGGNTIDHICYGICASGHTCTGEGGTNAPDYSTPSGGPNKSIARVPDHQDTNNNGTDWVISDIMTPGAPNSTPVPCDTTFASLSEIRVNNANGVPNLLSSFVAVRGIINVANFVLDSASRSNFYFQDDEAGINVFRGSAPAGIVEGDCVLVAGWVGQYNGLTEIVATGAGNCVYSCTRLTHVNPPAPTVITLNAQTAFESFEGMLVRVNNVNIVSGTWPSAHGWANLNVTDPDGQIIVRIVEWTNIGGTPAPTGSFDVVGILTQYDQDSPYTTGYQITPRYATDIIRHDGAAEENPVSTLPGDFKLVDVYPNPFNSVAQINFEVGSARELTMRIYDLLGREVATEIMTGLTPGLHTYKWTPNCSTGLYLVRLEGVSSVQTAKLLYLK